MNSSGTPDKPNRFVKWLIEQIAAAGVVALAAAIVAGIIALIAQTGFLLAAGITLTAFALLAIGGTTFVLWYRARSLRYISYPEPGFHIKVVSKRIAYEIKDDGALYYSRTIELEALVDHVDRYTDKFVWTGGASGLPKAGAGVSEVHPLTVAGVWTYYESMLDRSLRKGERTTIANHWPPLKNWAASSPFTSASSEERTGSIEIEIRIPATLRLNDNVIIEEMRSIESPHPFFTQADKFDNDRFVYSLKPKPYRHYRVRWAWKGASEIVVLEGGISDER
jgi:hypothetical protein